MKDEHLQEEIEKLQRCRELIALWVGMLKGIQLYDWGHNALQSLGQRIVDMTVAIVGEGGELDLCVRNDSIFIDGLRVREKSVGSASYQQLVALVRAAGLQTLRVDGDAAPEELEVLTRALLKASQGEYTFDELVRELSVRGATHVEVVLASEEEEAPAEQTPEQLQQRIYLRSIGILKGVFHEMRSKDRINARRVKRVVQEMIESLEVDPGYMLNLTSVKNYDEYTFNHSVNVGVLAIALGRAIGLSRRQLYVVGQAGMLHDIGKLCIPKEILNKPGRMTPEERGIVQSHPVEGFLSIATNQGVSVDTISVALGAYEHHLNLDGSGYPASDTQRSIGLLSRVVAIVDRYDAMTSARVYRTEPIPPPKTLAIMYHTQKGQLDATLLRYFMNMLGMYPLGTTVRLSDSSVAIVVGDGADETLPHMPRVQLVLDVDGRPVEGEVLDLGEDAKDPDATRIIETLNPSDYGIEFMDYIL